MGYRQTRRNVQVVSGRLPGRQVAGVGQGRRRAFTLVELLVVIVIIIVVSVIAIPPTISALSHRQVSEGARLLQAELAGARDAAIRDNAPTGIRLIPDPAFNGINPATGILDPALPLAYSRIIPIQQMPNYSEGLISQWQGPGFPSVVAALPYLGPGTTAIPNPIWGNTTALMAYESASDPSTGLPNQPTSWFWNIRIGDKLRINNAGKWYTVVGPMTQINPELFVNIGQPGTASPFLDAYNRPCEFLLLVNGLDDNQNGWKDEGWDGVDNDGINGVDDIGEWVEVEAW